MNLQIFLATFSAIFVAELADKTQLVGITMSAKSGKPFSVFLGSVCAYILVTGLSVIIGAVLGKFINPYIIRISGGIIFIIIGILMLASKI